jgi:hypothetical protein
LVGNPYKSYVPDADINAIDGFEIGQPYYGYALADMDLSAYLIPPIVVTTDVEQPVEPYHYYGTEATTDKSYYKVPVRFFDGEASLPATGEENIIYVAKAEKTSSYWDGAAYQPIGGGTSYSDEQAQDAVGTILSSEFSYDDATPQISINQIAYSKLTGTPTIPTQYTDEMAQDAVGSILIDSDTLDFTYDDATPTISAAVKKQMSLTSDSSGLKLSGDSATPGNDKYYGTDGSGAKGFYPLPTGGGSATLVKPGNTNYTAAAAEQAIVYETTLTGNRTVTIPTASGNTGLRITIANFQTATFLVLLSSSSSILLNGAAVSQLSKGDWITIMSDGTVWQVVQSVGKIGSGVFTLKSAGAQSALPNSATTQVTAYNFTLPANSLVKAGDKLVFKCWFKTSGGGADNINISFRTGTTTIIGRAATSYSSIGNEFTVEMVYQGATSTDFYSNTQSSGGFPSLVWSAATAFINWGNANDFNILFNTGATTTVVPVMCQYIIYKE